MRKAIDTDSFRFFNKYKFIELGPILSKEVCYQLKNTLSQLLAKRLKVAPDELSTRSFAETYAQGRYLWDQSDVLRKVILDHNLAELVKSLIQKSPVRLGFDQLIITPRDTNDTNIFSTAATLKDACSFQGVLLGLVINLSEDIESAESERLVPLAKHQGNALFFNPDLPLNFSQLQKTPGTFQWLITFVEDKAQYILQKTDPATHTLKSKGYVFGDRVLDKTHPIVIY